MKTPLALRTAAILGAWLLAGLAAAENEFPAFQPGLWSFTSTVTLKGANKPQVRTVRKCTNPTADIKKKWDILAMQSCKFSPMKHEGDRYSYTSFCEKNGLMLQSKSSIIVESSGAYRVETDSRTNNQTQKEVVEAKRLGDCAKQNGI
jgi:hypothetical protein